MAGGDASVSSQATSPTQDEMPVPGSMLKDGNLRVNYGAGNSQSPRRFVIPVEGVCPEDLPIRSPATQPHYDVRLMLPLTARYLGANGGKGVPVWVREGDFQRAIWRAVRREMQEHGWAGSMPAIIFEADRLDPRKVDGCVDVVYSSRVVQNHMFRCLKAITLEKPGKDPYRLHLSCSSNTLPGDIFPFDILRMPIDSSDFNILLESLNHMTRDVGTVTGFGYYVVTDQIDEPPHLRRDTIRAYIKLKPSSVTMPFTALACALPTHFVWRGIPRVMYYSGRNLRQVAVHSRNYPIEAAGGGSNVQDDTASSLNDSATGSGDESSSADPETSESSKRKRGRK